MDSFCYIPLFCKYTPYVDNDVLNANFYITILKGSLIDKLHNFVGQLFEFHKFTIIIYSNFIAATTKYKPFFYTIC